MDRCSANSRNAARLSDEDRLTRAWLMSVLAFDGLDPTLRAELTRQALAFTGFGTDGQLHRDKLDANLVGTALRVAAQDADRAFCDRPACAIEGHQRSGAADRIPGRHRLCQRRPLWRNGSRWTTRFAATTTSTCCGSMFRAEQAERNWPWLSANVDALLDKAPTFERNVRHDTPPHRIAARSAPMRWPRCSNLASVASTAGAARSIRCWNESTYVWRFGQGTLNRHAHCFVEVAR